MALGRQLFLWASENKWLEGQLTSRSFTRRAVRRFMPGESVDDALAAAASLANQGVGTILTQLGENVSEPRQADEVCRHYLTVLDQIHELELDADISIKPTQFGLDLGFDEAYERIRRVVQRASSLRRRVAIDMEGSLYIDPTLDLYRKLRVEHANVAICLQAYLHRTASDIASLLSSAPTIRLVKGAYKEPSSVAIRRKSDVDANFLELSQSLLEQVHRGNARVYFGTHDPRVIDSVCQQAAALGLKKNAFEIQMLYGIQRENQIRLAADGRSLRVLISYGDSWFPWYMRRLA
ncbi:MAG TPA: proline dehydrogenase family protein, partial [Gemmatimonadota bacterium]|nr:proline dehydrogenase family protein [Gemmatimonadota bacterium]